ncbi:MAG: hypothetical protein KC931_21135, partial [Candidatus Omnitrophica bacterium]|nr:hypothetical protein [Candidatus Omnitrophota bacterium]
LQDGDIINANSLPVAIGKRKSPILKSTQASPLLPFKSAKDRIVKNFEKEYLENLLRTCEGNVTRAAETAEMERSSLQRLLRKHSLNSRDFKKVSNLA